MVYYDKVPQYNYIYCIMEEKVHVRVQYVMVIGVIMPTIKETNEFTKKIGNKKIKKRYIDKSVLQIGNSDLEEIH